MLEAAQRPLALEEKTRTGETAEPEPIEEDEQEEEDDEEGEQDEVRLISSFMHVHFSLVFIVCILFHESSSCLLVNQSIIIAVK